MDASQLRNAIYDLRRECSELERENNSMQREINAICNSVKTAACSLASSCDTASRTLDNSTNIIEYSDKAMQEVMVEQERIDFLYRGFKNIESANKKIREINNKIYFEFANFRMVRKIVRAFIDNINLDIVNTDLIYKSVEKEHLQSPDFWLSCSMLAIMHWKEDDQAAAQRAIDQAMKLDARQTILFFMSFNLLLGRKDAALKWFECYIQAKKTGDDADFVLLLLHATNLREDTNDRFTKRIREYLIAEYERSKPMNDIDLMVETVKSHLIQYNSSETFAFDSLRNYLKDYGTMANVLSMAKDNAAIMEFVETANCSLRGKGYIYIERFISDLLDAPDKKERAYTDEIAYNETIIKCLGDLAKADEEYNAKHQHDISPLNLMSECINWLFGRRSAEISEVARSNMFLLCRDLVEKAAKQYFAEYRANCKSVHPAVIKDYTTDINFNDKPAEVQKVERFYAQKEAAQLATVKNTSTIVSFVLAAICLAGGIVSLVFNSKVDGNILLGVMGVLFLMTSVSALAAVLKIFGNKRKRTAIVDANTSAANNAKRIMDSLFDEYMQYQVLYEESDKIADDIIFAINR